MDYRCPVCFFDEMSDPPQDYNICPCCGTEFGNDDVEYTYAELRQQWADSGAQWFFGQPPANWNAWAQLASGGFGVSTGISAAASTEIVGAREEYQVA